MRKKTLVGIVIIMVIGIICFINYSNNKFKSVTKNVIYNGDNLKISIDGELVSALPTSGDYYLTNYTCDNPNTKFDWDIDNHLLSVNNDVEAGVNCSLNFESKVLLSDMNVGDYVDYTGSNGCSKCNGDNANYSNDNTGMGYCGSSDAVFKTKGWRIAYISDGNVYLVSAGAPECMCTDSGGSASSNCSSSLSSNNLSTHYTNMNNIALKYCNTTYADDGVCNANTAWAMNANDFQKITGQSLTSDLCSGYGNKACGYNNSLIDNGGYYWFAANNAGLNADAIFFWNSGYSFLDGVASSAVYGVRPIIKLDQRVVATGGTGTYDNPYHLSYDATRDNTAPLCSITGPTGNMYNGYVNNGDTLVYNVTCTDNSGDVTEDLSVDDFTVGSTSIMTVSNISESKKVSDGYSWDVTVTAGSSTGSSTLTLKNGAITDYMGNKNPSITSTDSVNTDNDAPSCGTTTYSTTSATSSAVTVSVPCTDSLSGCASSSYSKSVSSNGSSSITIADKVGNTKSCSYSVSNIYQLSISSTVTKGPYQPHCNTNYWYERKWHFSITATGYGVSSGKMCFSEDGSSVSSNCGNYPNSGKNSAGVACFDSSTSWYFYRAGGFIYAYVCNSAGKCTSKFDA